MPSNGVDGPAGRPRDRMGLESIKTSERAREGQDTPFNDCRRRSDSARREMRRVFAVL